MIDSLQPKSLEIKRQLALAMRENWTRRWLLTCWLLALSLSLAAAPVQADEIRAMVSGGFTAPYQTLVAEWQQATGHTVTTVYGASMGATPTAIPNRLARGEAADIVILARTALDQLAKDGTVLQHSEVDLVRSRIGMAVRAGTATPDISSEARFRQVLLAARSVAYSESASGVYISTEMFRKMGIAEQMALKSRMISGAPVGESVARGEAELGFQQMSELLPVRGISIVGPIPDSVQMITIFSGGVVATSRSQATARQLLAYLSSKQAWTTIRLSGLEPIAAATATATAIEPATLLCTGTRAAGAAAVILESGAGNGVEAWAKVQPAIAEFARVCTYERPGLRRHWPDGRPTAAPTANAVVETLDAVLVKAGEPPPYVLVGHSYGGMIVRLYASRFPDRVKGVVLIDSSHEDQIRRFGEPAPPPARGGSPVVSMPEVFDLAGISDALKARPWRTSVPLLVLTRGNAGSANPAAPPDAAAMARYDIWLELQRDLATRSPHAEHIIARNSGHYIQNDEPPLVIEGVRRMVANP